MSNLLRIIQQMRPKSSDADEDEEPKENKKTDADRKKEKFPSLTKPNDDKVRVSNFSFLNHLNIFYLFLNS